MKAREVLAVAKFYFSVTVYYMVTLIFGVYIFRPQLLGGIINQPEFTPVVLADIVQSEKKQNEDAPQIIQGKPIRILVSSLGIDLSVIDGNYNPTDQSWTLTDDKAHFALPSLPANDLGGSTLIYGHNTPPIFKKLGSLATGAKAEIYTDNGYIFSYVFSMSETIAPNNTETFSYIGPPILTLQTCSGVWSETREMFTFKFESVKKHEL